MVSTKTIRTIKLKCNSKGSKNKLKTQTKTR